ncbi:MAG TPA: two-component regulator propeller domain-containing protein [Mucilaginibacter sp.]|jgi:signal transduction histidine kinase/ligand-binding sensor domain-containing protein
MRWLLPFLFFSLTASANTGSQVREPFSDSGQHVVIDYPGVLQKAGIKKARCIFKDSRGLIWIGTENGLYRYDGTNIDYISHQVNNYHTIPNNGIINITEDKHSNIWIGTMEGVACLDAYTLKCKVYNKALKNFNADFDNKVYADTDGKIWVGNSTGIYLLNEKTNVFNAVWNNLIKGKASSSYVTCLTNWKNDTLVAGTFVDAVLINKKDFHFRRLHIAESDLTFTRLFVDRRQRIWMGTWGNGCIISDDRCKNFTVLKWERPPARQSANIVTAIIATNYNHDQNLWVSTFQGVYKIPGYLNDAKKHTVQPVLADSDGPVNSMMADDDQYIWLAGFNVSRFFAGQRFFRPLSRQLNGVIENIQEINLSGNKYLALSGWYNPSGLLILDRQGRSVIYKQKKQTNPDGGNISGVAVDKYNRLWVSSFAGIKILNNKFRHRPVFPKLNIKNDRLTSVKTNNIQINHDTVWISCYKRGVDLFDLNFHKLKTFLKNDGSGLKDDLIQRIFTDSKGNIWLCGNSYLYRYVAAESRFISYNLSGENSLFSVNDIAELPGHELLIASDAGLFRFDPVSKKHSEIYTPLLTRDLGVQSVTVDAWGDIWYITKEHLVYYRTKTKQFTLFGQEDGLTTRNDLYWLRTFDGKKFYLAEYDKLVAFSPKETKMTLKPVGLYFHSIQVNDSALSSIPGTGNKLNLTYKQSRVLIEFGAINYIKPEQNLYAFRLSGVDDKWIFTTHNYASYSNLIPGAYIFNLKAQNVSGLWSRPITLTMIIHPPYWATWWFRLISLVLVSSLLLAAVRYVLQRNLREKILKLEKEQAIEIERNRIARDMHDDLGSGLTKIAILSEVTKAHIKNQQPATANLDVISTASRELVDSLQDIIWVLNPKNDSVESLVLYLKEYAESFFELTPVSLQFVYDYETGDTSLSEEKRRNIFLVVKECCNNILKHAGATNVDIGINVQDGLLVIDIADNGKGFEAASISRFSNGLQNMKNRVQQIGGEFNLISVPERGTRIKCQIPV